MTSRRVSLPLRASQRSRWRLRLADAEGQTQSNQHPGDELAQMKAEVARLRSERAALLWAVGHDELTGLANRRLFNESAPPLLRRRGQAAAVAVIDLNGFKPINDRFGHQSGDYVLRVIARRMTYWAGGDLVARLGGDEFAVVLTRRGGQHQRRWWGSAIGALSMAIAEPIQVAGHSVVVSASIGVASADGKTPVSELLRDADQAMYAAKALRHHHVDGLGISTTSRARISADQPGHDPRADHEANEMTKRTWSSESQSWRNINRQLGRISQVTLAGPAGTATQTTPLKTEQRAIYQALSVEPPIRAIAFDPT